MSSRRGSKCRIRSDPIGSSSAGSSSLTGGAGAGGCVRAGLARWAARASPCKWPSTAAAAARRSARRLQASRVSSSSLAKMRQRTPTVRSCRTYLPQRRAGARLYIFKAHGPRRDVLKHAREVGANIVRCTMLMVRASYGSQILVVTTAAARSAISQPDGCPLVGSFSSGQ